MSGTAIELPRGAIEGFCRRWKITELALFGPVPRADFGPDARWSLLDHVTMEEELAAILGRPVDLVSKRGIERSRNWIRRREILSTAEPYYAAR